MKLEQEIWTVKDLFDEKDNIQIAPAWQRGPSWNEPRQVLLIDSMLRGLDIPKIYLRASGQPNAYAYDAVDGQQRLRSIWKFRNDELFLKHSEKLEPVGNEAISGKKFSQLSKNLRDQFENFPIIVAKIVQSGQLEISRLFSRLQQGVPLNPAELRNAMLGPVRNTVETISLSHKFFEESRIPEARYRRQDYVAHILALATHGVDRDVKAQNLKQLYQEFTPAQHNKLLSLSAELNIALDFMQSLNKLLAGTIRHKWIVVDLAWWAIQQNRQNKPIDLVATFDKFEKFDSVRKEYTSSPEGALGDKSLGKKLGQELYHYLVAFKLQGGTKLSLETRSKAVTQFLAP